MTTIQALNMAEAPKDFRYIVRVANTDLDGNKKIISALRKIKGVSFMMANALCSLANVPQDKKTGALSNGEVTSLENALKGPQAAGFPTWMLNRRKDYETGDDLHISGADLRYQKDNDIKLLKKIKSYKGMRHAFGLPARGQSTKSNFRKKKGKGSLGVQRKKGKK